MAIIIFLWIFSAVSIPKESSPDIEFGIISITTIYQWVNPHDIDNLITQKIEKEIKDQEWIKKISSTSSVGVSNIIVEFKNDVDITKALVDIKDLVDKVSLPSESEDPIVSEISSDNELMFIALLYWDENSFSPMMLNDIANKLKINLEWNWKINRVDIGASIMWSANVAIWGAGQGNYEIEILVDKNKLDALWLTLLQVSQSIKSRNQNQPLGNHDVWEFSYDYRIEWELRDINQIKEIPISTKKWYIYLGDVAVIQEVLVDDSINKLGSFNLSGQSFISLWFNKNPGENLFESAKSAKQLLDQELQKFAYNGLKYYTVYDLSNMISDDYQKLAKNWLQTILLVFLCLLVFVGFKESLIATVTIPLAFLITFIVLNYLWLSLNFLTNFSLIITFGIAIDTTIVIIEWAHEKMRMGFSPKHAVLLSVRDYKAPLISWTSTTLVVFLPLLSLPGVLWKFLAYIPITIFATLLAALIISLTLNSALYYKLSRPKKHYEEWIVDEDYMTNSDKQVLAQDRIWKVLQKKEKIKIYEKLLDSISKKYSTVIWKIMKNTKSRFFSIAISLIAFFLFMGIIAPQLWFNLFPSNDNWIMSFEISATRWTTQEELSNYVKPLETILSKQPEIRVYNFSVNNNKIWGSIELFKKSDFTWNVELKDIFELEKILNSDFDYFRSRWLESTIQILKDWPPSEWVVGLKLTTESNSNFWELMVVAQDFKDFLSNLSWSKNTTISSEVSPGQFVFKFDKNILTELWFSPNEINFGLFVATNWINAGSIKGSYDDHDIKIKYQQFESGLNPSDIESLSINIWKVSVTAGDLLDYEFESSIAQISRENTKITISVDSDVEEWFISSDLQAEFVEFAKNYSYPDWINYEAWGESSENAELIQSMWIAFIVSLILIFGILVLQFNSFVQPLIIMFSILMGLLWATFGLFVTGNTYSLMFMIGFIALTGIVINDAIVLLDRSNQNVKRWMKRFDAVVEAWKSRLQPIILTTITTILWLSSIVWDMMWQPLAVTIMFGMFFGSAMTLFVIPAIYYDREKIVHLFKRILLKPLITLWIFAVIVLLVLVFAYLLNIEIRKLWYSQNLLWWLFLVYIIRITIYSAKKLAKNWRYFVWDILWLRMESDSKHSLSFVKILFGRNILKTISLLWPILVYFIVSFLFSLFFVDFKHFQIKKLAEGFQTLQSSILGKILLMLVIIWYLFFIFYSLYRFRLSNKNQFLYDQKLWISIRDKRQRKDI